METEKKVATIPPVISFLQREDVKSKFVEILGKRGNAFISSVLTLVNQNDKLKVCNKESIYMCAMQAATLDLSIHPSLGMAYIIPYSGVATFQIGYKGILQLAQRSGQFKTIDCKAIYEGQIVKDDSIFGGEKIVWSEKKSDKILGYAGYFSLINGFEKIQYWSIEQIKAHGQRFSKTYNSGPWKTDFEAMATKTVLKLLLGKYAPMSLDMQRAFIGDQAVIKDVETMEVEYVDEGHAELTLETLTEQFNQVKDKLTEEHIKFAERVLNPENPETASFTKLSILLKSFGNEPA